jgi:hypothetical protein
MDLRHVDAGRFPLFAEEAQVTIKALLRLC